MGIWQLCRDRHSAECRVQYYAEQRPFGAGFHAPNADCDGYSAWPAQLGRDVLLGIVFITQSEKLAGYRRVCIV
jgi:hypothetical protein